MVITSHRGIRPLALLILLPVVGLHSAPVAAALPLWELTNTSNRIRLLGSIHFLRAADYPLDPAITAAFDDADVVLMEIDMDDLDPRRGQPGPEIAGTAGPRCLASGVRRSA